MASIAGPSQIMLVTAGDPQRLTGGNLYNRHVLRALQSAGTPALQVPLPLADPSSAADTLRTVLKQQRPALAIVDSIALEAAAPLASWVKRHLGAKIIALMHMLPSDLGPYPQRNVLQRLENQLLSRADLIVAPSDSLAQRLAGAGAPAGQIAVIAPGKDGVPVPSQCSEGCETVRFLCVANWSPSKGIHTLIEAMARLPSNTSLDLVGSGEDGPYSAHVSGLIRWNLLADRVHIHGPLEGQALSRRYAAADVFVLPSAAESFGIAYAEAMTFGLPVIGCPVGPLPWLVGKGCGVLVPAGDVAALVRAMRGFLDEPSLRRRMGQAASRRAGTLPTWQQTSEAFVRYVRGLLPSFQP